LLAIDITKQELSELDPEDGAIRVVGLRPNGLHPRLEIPGIIAKSAAMTQVVEMARRMAKVDSTILITGESGSGKERIAHLVHEQSSRRAGPFVAVNCGAIAESLVESEFFGHARGAFTGATQDRPGLFEAANRGTLFLDEIGDLSPAMQSKLLRVLQEREVRRVGENRNRPIDVRVLAATNCDLTERVLSGQFRQDLFYRINVVELHVPALRERRIDILDLARVLLADATLQMKHADMNLTPESAEQLLRYDWPGNVRELENAMGRAVALARGSRVELEDLPDEVRQMLPGLRARAGRVRPLEEVVRECIVAALASNGGNQKNAAEQLKIGTATMYRKLKSYGLIAKRP
jgi:two-component system, NtrC family, response regulator HydG